MPALSPYCRVQAVMKDHSCFGVWLPKLITCYKCLVPSVAFEILSQVPTFWWYRFPVYQVIMCLSWVITKQTHIEEQIRRGYFFNLTYSMWGGKAKAIHVSCDSFSWTAFHRKPAEPNIRYFYCRCMWDLIAAIHTYIPLILWPPGWWGGRCRGPRRYTPPHVHAPATQPCTPWRRLPRRARSGRWSSWRAKSHPGWDAPSWPTPDGQ